MTQTEALNILKTGANVFLTGEPGSGKTHTINQYIAYLREHGVEPAITASTGIAATHVGGYTIHSWSGVGVRERLTPYDLDAISSNKTVYERVRSSHVLIIDEVSMLSAVLLGMVDEVCRSVRHNEKPFGGMQVILVGDFFQLPPIVKKVFDEGAQDVFDEEPSAPFAFTAPVWRASAFLVCYLTEQHRQEDEMFLELLSALRRGTIARGHHELLQARVQKPERARDITQLYSHNADVDLVNDQSLGKIDSDAYRFVMHTQGRDRLVETLKRGCLSPEVLVLKEGARVMCTKNDMLRRYVNGTTGVVTGFVPGSGHPIVKTNKGSTIVIEPVEWTVQDNGRVLAKITQVPLRLAWAITVHKSQGMSLDSAHIDLRGAFEYGQGYVALSRVRTLSGLTLAGFNDRSLLVHPQVADKDQEFRDASQDARESFASMSGETLTQMHHNFLRAAGGTTNTEAVAEKRALKLKQKKASKKSTAEVTGEYILQKKSLKDIAREREFAEGTILGHVEELVEKGLLTRDDILYLADGKKTALEAICAVFREAGHTPLRPVFEKLGGKTPYETIRLARLLYQE